MFDHMHWSMWVLFACMLTTLVVFAFYCIFIEPVKQRRRIAEIQRGQECYEYVLHLLKHPHHDFNDVVPRWKELSAERQQNVLDQIPTLLTSEGVDTYDLCRKLASLKENPLSALISRDVRTAVARTSIERTPNGLDVYELAREAWGSGKIPTDILVKIIEHGGGSEEEIIKNEIRPDNINEIATACVKMVPYDVLESLFGKHKVPETYQRMYLDSILEMPEVERDYGELIYVYKELKDWESLLAFVREHMDDVEECDLFGLLRETPEEIFEKIAAIIASQGRYQSLCTFYNPAKEEGDDEKESRFWPEVTPPEHHLRACLEALMAQVNDAPEAMHPYVLAAYCCVLLKDVEMAKKILPACIERQYIWAVGVITCALYAIEKGDPICPSATTT